MRLKLHELAKLSQIEELNQVTENQMIYGISDRSMNVKEGFIFVAIEGFEADGHDYIGQAIENGAGLVIGQRERADLPVPYIKVKNTREVIGKISAAFYGFPSKKKLVIGVTGTNGKTTTSLFIRHLLKKLGYTVSFFGTVFNEINGKREKSFLTTPNASILQQTLAKSNDEAVVIEVSSQGLEQYRMEGMLFDYALFTNLQHDHLDYHKTIDAYFLAKKRLFSLLKSDGKAIVFTDDKWGLKLASLLRKEAIDVLTVGSRETDNFQLSELDTLSGMLSKDEQSTVVSSPLPGGYNIINACMAGAVIHCLGHPLSKLAELMNDLEPIPGRFEKYKIHNNLDVVVDYAHTPEALFVLFSTLKDLYPTHKKVNIFGFRGNRDKTKRAEMIEISSRMNDATVLTLDDLNGVPEAEMEKEYIGYSTKENVSVVMDRTLALKQEIEGTDEPTVIILTGKGHENYRQKFELPTTSDRETVEWFMNEQNA